MSIPPTNILSSKKAQDSAGSAATLIAVIALLIIFYLLFIPPSFRDQILEGNESTSTTSSVTGNETILRANPGTLSTISSQEMQHTIASVTLYSTQASKILGSLSSITVKSSIFTFKNSSMKFTIDDLANTDNMLLTFTDKDTKGNLIIKINGNEVYNSEVTKENPEPIRLDKSMLVQGQNTITLEAEKAGWKFWRVNRHNIGNLQVTGDVKDISRQKSQNVFVISATERANAKSAMLKFLPDCVEGNAGKLNILVNEHSIYYSVPDCGTTAVIEFATDILREGENTIVFDSEQGNYIIDMISISSELKSVLQPAFYFQITNDMITDVRNGKYSIMLNMQFTEGTEQKSAKLNINGRETNIYQTESSYTKNINDYIIEGNNAIKIIPDTTLEIVTLEVVRK